MTQTIGDRIKAVRLKMDITQTELAKRSGVSQAAIGNYESNVRQPPPQIVSLAEALGVEPVWLAFGRESPDLLDTSK